MVSIIYYLPGRENITSYPLKRNNDIAGDFDDDSIGDFIGDLGYTNAVLIGYGGV